MKAKDFTFKKFHIHQSRCAQKVSTDACIFGGILSRIVDGHTLLDVGSGTGLLSLMIAQKAQIQITGVEMNPYCYEDSLSNLQTAVFSNQINFVCADIREYKSLQSYDWIISNPPFYDGTLPSTDHAKSIAKHNTTLAAEDWTQILERNANPGTMLGLLLAPNGIAEKYRSQLGTQNFSIVKEYRIKNKSQSKAHTLIWILQKLPLQKPVSEDIIIKNQDDSYTEQMTLLMCDYYLHL